MPLCHRWLITVTTVNSSFWSAWVHMHFLHFYCSKPTGSKKNKRDLTKVSLVNGTFINFSIKACRPRASVCDTLVLTFRWETWPSPELKQRNLPGRQLEPATSEQPRGTDCFCSAPSHWGLAWKRSLFAQGEAWMARLGRTGWHVVHSYWDQGGVGGREGFFFLCFHPSNAVFPASYQSYSCGGNDVTPRHRKWPTSLWRKGTKKTPVVVHSVFDKPILILQKT